MASHLKLRVPVHISSEDVEKAWLEQARRVPAVSRAYDDLRSAAAQAADRLNQALEIDMSDWFTRGWAAVGEVRDAIQRGLLSPGSPEIIRLDRHTLASTSYLALNTEVDRSALPELEFVLHLSARVPNATLAIKDGAIELLALGDVIVTARLVYDDVLLNQHVTSVEGAPRDPFKRHPPGSGRRSRTDQLNASA